MKFSSNQLKLISEIVSSHQDLLIEQRESAECLVWTQDNAVYLIVKQAAWELGFIDQDAECIALAWLMHTSDINHLNPSYWPNDPKLFGLSLRHGKLNFAACRHDLGLYVVAPDAQWVKKLAQAGVKTIQLRFKSTQADLIEKEIVDSISACLNEDISLFINDHWQLAIKHQAYGIHLGQEDLVNADLDLIRKSSCRLGISSHGYAEMINADQYSPSYIAIGAVYPTTLKQMQTAAQGIGRLRQYAKLLEAYPLVGIGGISEDRIHDVLQTGVGSVALVRAVINSLDYVSAIKNLQDHF
ncbi:MAG: thiamine phosphate synthase [Betaproteobacteria bacterium]|jgi:thiamine-phosphate pyrophosphorylase